MKKEQQFQGLQTQYLPLLNNKGLKAFLTPFFAGHLAIDHDHFVLEPASELTLRRPNTPRNVMFTINQKRYDLNAMLEHQIQESYIYETGHAYQRVKRMMGPLHVDTVSFLPLDDAVEIHHITITNDTDEPVKFQATTAFEIYGRSAENQRDHRHVTSLLNGIDIFDQGIIVTPRLHFDESGHHINQRNYFFFALSDTLQSLGVIPTVDQFLGNGSFMFPKPTVMPVKQGHIDGYEAIGAVVFKETIIPSKDSVSLTLLLGSDINNEAVFDIINKYQTIASIEAAIDEAEAHIYSYIDQLNFNIYSEAVSQRLEDVSLQPMYRRFMGNSYMPHHDYGKGGRGWRDLWQDLIALNMYHNPDVYDMLYQYFKGVRLDGSNATIIGDEIGAFKADRNQIARVWSDHGAWPLITLKMYMDETGDLDILFKKQVYFQDHFTHYAQKTRPRPKENFTTYEGTILEHLLIQHIVAVNHLGKHGFIKLMDADWNDGLDMGKTQGETIAFTMMYVKHLNVLSTLIQASKKDSLILYKPLVDLLKGVTTLEEYFESATHEDAQETIPSQVIIDALDTLYKEKVTHLRTHAYMHDIYQSYIDHHGQFLDNESTVMLTGQAMALLNGIATPEQARQIATKTREKLYDASIGGYKLNSLYDASHHGLGRAFYFAYYHKENGAVFSHMVMMYAYGLYEQGLVEEGHEAFMTIIKQSLLLKSDVYRGIPEYFNDQGIGKYAYLTGSASWLVYILRRQVFGLKFDLGNLYLEPKLTKEDFIEGQASIETITFGKKTRISYNNLNGYAYGQYNILSIVGDGSEISLPIKKHYDEIIVQLG